MILIKNAYLVIIGCQRVEGRGFNTVHDLINTEMFQGEFSADINAFLDLKLKVLYIPLAYYIMTRHSFLLKIHLLHLSSITMINFIHSNLLYDEEYRACFHSYSIHFVYYTITTFS